LAHLKNAHLLNKHLSCPNYRPADKRDLLHRCLYCAPHCVVWARICLVSVYTAIDFVLTDGAVSAVGGIEAASALSLGITGAIEGGVLTPSKETDGSSFFVGRLENAAIDAASFATMGGVGKAVAGALGGGAGLVERVIIGAVSNGFGGMAGGIVAAEGQALTQGRNATVNELAHSIVQNALLGAAFGAGSELGFAGVHAISDAVKGPIKPGDTVLPRVENASPRAADVAKLIEVKGNISSGFASDVVKAVGDLPPQVLKLLADNNVRISVGEKIADVDPSLVGQTPRGWKSGKWENANGYYDPYTKQVVITEKKKVGFLFLANFGVDVARVISAPHLLQLRDGNGNQAVDN
jgi:hypothetical protein